MQSLLSDRFAYDGKSELLLNQVQERALYEVKEKENNGEYVFEEYDCDCGVSSKELITIAEKDRYGLKVYTKICPNCGLVMTNPRMTQDSYNHFYDAEYRRLYSGRTAMSDAFFLKQYDRGKKIYQFVDEWYDIGIINNILEIGCGAGGILKYFADKGISVKGIDLGSEYINYGIGQGLDLQCTSAADLVLGGGKSNKYDLVILHHVFEHFLDVSGELKIISQLLNPNGILFVEVPGIGTIPDVYHGNILRFLQNAHIRHFTLDTLKQLMERNRFEYIAGNEKVMGLFKYNENIKFEFRNNYEDVMQTLKKLEKMYSQKTYSREEYNMCQRERNKLNNIADVQQQWLNAYSKGGSVKEWLGRHEIKRIAIYGYGILGQQLYKELQNTEIDISYIVDLRDLQLKDTKQYFPDDKLPSVDAIIITPVSQYMEIETKLKRKNTELKVLKFVDILQEL